MALTKFNADVYENDRYRLIILDDGDGLILFELYRIIWSFTEMGDAESGPLGLARELEGFKLECHGLGKPADDLEAFMEDPARYGWGFPEEACPGCGWMPGDGINPACSDDNGCGYLRWTEGSCSNTLKSAGVNPLGGNDDSKEEVDNA